MDEFTIKLISKALDATYLRQAVIASNVANANSHAYQAMRVEFESHLNDVSNIRQLDAFNPIITTTNKATSIDTELALSMKNTTQYRALIKGVNHHFAIMQIALRGGQ